MIQIVFLFLVSCQTTLVEQQEIEEPKIKEVVQKEESIDDKVATEEEIEVQPVFVAEEKVEQIKEEQPPVISEISETFIEPQSYEVELQWEDKSEELGAFLIIPNGEYIYYSNPESLGKEVVFSSDYSDSIQIEKITTEKLQEQGEYVFYVLVFAGQTPLGLSNAKVIIKNNDKLLYEFDVPKIDDMDLWVWEVFRVIDGSFEIVNNLIDYEPYI